MTGEENEKNNYCTLMFLRQRSMTQRPGTATHNITKFYAYALVYRVMSNHVSDDTAFIVAMHPMHRKEKYNSLGLDIFGPKSLWP